MSKKIFVSDESKIECCKSQIDDFPNARSKHAVCHHSRHIYIHSGIDRNLPHRDFWRYNVGEFSHVFDPINGDFVERATKINKSFLIILTLLTPFVPIPSRTTFLIL